MGQPISTFIVHMEEIRVKLSDNHQWGLSKLDADPTLKIQRNKLLFKTCSSLIKRWKVKARYLQVFSTIAWAKSQPFVLAAIASMFKWKVWGSHRKEWTTLCQGDAHVKIEWGSQLRRDHTQRQWTHDQLSQILVDSWKEVSKRVVIEIIVGLTTAQWRRAQRRNYRGNRDPGAGTKIESLQHKVKLRSVRT